MARIEMQAAQMDGTTPHAILEEPPACAVPSARVEVMIQILVEQMAYATTLGLTHTGGRVVQTSLGKIQPA